MWMLVGLGNPGTKYERTRHNVGFRVADELARRHGLSWKSSKLGGELATGTVGSERVVMVKPMEFMNLSGFAVQRAAQFHEVEVDNIVVIHDEIDLDFGTLRLKAAGGHGGHNGLRSIIEQLGKPDFLRVRVGVGKPPGATADKDVSGWVLSAFSEDPEALITRAADATEAILASGLPAAMRTFN
jgi:PTH1 family peptidyl-tRNA hydrolase